MIPRKGEGVTANHARRAKQGKDFKDSGAPLSVKRPLLLAFLRALFRNVQQFSSGEKPGAPGRTGHKPKLKTERQKQK